MQKSSEPFRHNPTVRQFPISRYDLRGSPSHFEYSQAPTPMESGPPSARFRHIQPPCRAPEGRRGPVKSVRDQSKTPIPYSTT